jgi:hypothetical protein
LDFGPVDDRTEEEVRMSKEELVQMALMALFWAAMVVLLSAVFGYGAPGTGSVRAVYDFGTGSGARTGENRPEGWNGLEVYRNLEGIWDAARMSR